MSDTYLTTPIPLDEFRHWKWLQVNNLRISYDEYSSNYQFFDEVFTLWGRDEHELKDERSITVFVKSGMIMGFRRGGDLKNADLFKVIKKQFDNEIECVGYILEKYL